MPRRHRRHSTGDNRGGADTACIDLTSVSNISDEVCIDLTGVNDSFVVVMESNSDTPSRHGRRGSHQRNTSDPVTYIIPPDTPDRGDSLLFGETQPFRLSLMAQLIERLQNVNWDGRIPVVNVRASTPLDDKRQCPVCLDTYSQIMTAGSQLYSTTCGHLFCESCVKMAIDSQGCCPTCRKKLTLKKIHPIYL